MLVGLALFIQFVIVGGSGLLIYINHHDAGLLLRLIHEKVGILMLVFFIAYITLQWRWIVFTVKKYYQKNREIKEGEVIEANYIPID